MDISAILVWALRIVLPIVLFAIYFKLQSPKDEGGYPGPSKHSYSRLKLLQQRDVVGLDCPVPESMATITLVDATRAPHLFAPPSNRRGGGGGRKGGEKGSGGNFSSEKGGEKGGGGGGSAPSAASGAAGGDSGAASCAGSGGGAGEKAAGSERAATATGAGSGSADAEERACEPQCSQEKAEVVESTPPAPPVVDHVAEEKMHVASLVNYVAFNRREQQRRFLLEESAPPPPPPRPRPREAKKTDGGSEPAVSAEMAEKANSEAQMVLSGAIRFKRADVAKKLYEQLVDSQVEIVERSFALMIETCVLACDLKSASDFLMKMEAAGHCPDTELLDKVMDLYSQQKSMREMEKEKEMQAAAAAQQAQAAQAQAASASQAASRTSWEASPSQKPRAPASRAPAARASEEWEGDWEGEGAEYAEKEEEYDGQGTYDDEWGASPAADLEADEPAACEKEAEEEEEEEAEHGSMARAVSEPAPAPQREELEEKEEEPPPEESRKKHADAERPKDVRGRKKAAMPSPPVRKAEPAPAASSASNSPGAASPAATPAASPELPVPKARGSGRKSWGKASAVEESPVAKGSAPSAPTASTPLHDRTAGDDADHVGAAAQDQSYLPATPEPPSPVMPRIQPGSDLGGDPGFQPHDGKAFSSIGLATVPLSGVDFPGADAFAFAGYPAAGGETMVQMVPTFMEYQPDGSFGCYGFPGEQQQFMTVMAPAPPAEGQRTKLSSKSRLFVPGGMQQPVPPPPMQPLVQEGGTRLALKASAKPFQPGASLSFDAYPPMWTADVPAAMPK